jgi:hypothetical protein
MNNQYNLNVSQYTYYSVEVYDGNDYHHKFVKCHNSKISVTNFVAACFDGKQFNRTCVEKVNLGYQKLSEKDLPAGLNKENYIKNSDKYLVPFEMMLPKEKIVIIEPTCKPAFKRWGKQWAK